jgi:hypothetical protein
MTVEVEVTLWLTNSQSVCLGIEHPCGTCDQILLPVGVLLSEICSLISVRLSDERTGLQFAVYSLNGLNHAEPVTILYCLIWDSPTWTARFPYLYIPGTGWPSYTPGHWVPFTSSLTTCRAMVEVSNPPSTWRARSPYIYPSGTGWSSPKSKLCYDQWSVNQYVLVSSPRRSRDAPSEWISIWHQEGFTIFTIYTSFYGELGFLMTCNKYSCYQTSVCMLFFRAWQKNCHVIGCQEEKEALSSNFPISAEVRNENVLSFIPR